MRVIYYVFLVIVLWTDLKKYRIRNWTLLLGLALGMYIRFMESGIRGLGLGLISMLIPFVLLYPFYLIKTFGAGDIKLLSTIAVLMNPSQCVVFFAVTFFIGGILAIGKILVEGNGKERWRCLKTYLLNCFYCKTLLPYQEHLPHGNENKKMVIHFSIPIVLSCVLWLNGLY